MKDRQWNGQKKNTGKNNAPQNTTHSTGFRGPQVKVYSVFLTSSVIGLSHFLNNPSVIFLTQLHSISECCRILNTPIIFALLKLINGFL